MDQTLYRKYRPTTFAEVVGQEHIVRTLENALSSDKLGHAYLFTGPRGTGKTTLARLLAKAANCTDRKGAEPCGKCENCILIRDGRSLDLIEFDAATHTQVDKMREILEAVPIPPASGRYKVYIIDEAHMLSPGAWNAFLKTLEEPPAHAIFILATTALHKVPETIVSRCQRFDLARFPVEKIIEKLRRIAKSEKLKMDDAALRLIALSAEGGMRDAESLLTQVATLQESPITEDDAAAILGLTSHEKIQRFAGLLIARDLPGSLRYVRELSERGESFSSFAPSLLRYLRVVLLASIDPSAAEADLASFTKEQRTTLLETASSMTPDTVVSLIEYFQEAERNLKNSSIPELPLEIAAVKYVSRESRITPARNALRSEAGGNQESRENQPKKKSDSTPKESRIEEEEEEESEKTNHEPARIATQSVAGGSRITNHEEEKKRVQTPNKEIPKKSADTEDDDTDNEPATFSFEDVKDKWRDIIREATKLNASLTLALTNAKPTKTEGKEITIAVRFPFHKERLAEPKGRLTLKEAFDTILGAETRISVIVSDEAEKAKHPLISQALEMLGGKVV